MVAKSSSLPTDSADADAPPHPTEDEASERSKTRSMRMAPSFAPVHMAKAFKKTGAVLASPVAAGVKSTRMTVKRMVSRSESSRDDSSSLSEHKLVVRKQSTKEASMPEEKSEKNEAEEAAIVVSGKEALAPKSHPSKESLVNRIKSISQRTTVATMKEMFLFSLSLGLIPTFIAWDRVSKNEVPVLVAFAWCLSFLLIDRSLYRMENRELLKDVLLSENLGEPELVASVEVERKPEKLSARRRSTKSLQSQLLELEYPPPPPPPTELPPRFLAAGKGNPEVGQQRLQQTLDWRKEQSIDYILRQKHPQFELIKKHYPHYFHLRGKDDSPVYYESPPKTDLQALREGGCNLDILLRHYAMVTEAMWQHIERSDSGKSIFVVDLEGMGMWDFAGEVVDFVKQATQFTGAHYPERMGIMMVINVPSWFKMVYNVLKPLVDEDTLKKIAILRGKDEIFAALSERIPVENIPPEYGGTSMPLGESPEEKLMWDLMEHNNNPPARCLAQDPNHDCYFCKFELARCY